MPDPYVCQCRDCRRGRGEPLDDDYDDYDDDYDDDDNDPIDSYGSNNRQDLFLNVDMTNPYLLGLEIETCINSGEDVGPVAKKAASLMGGFAERDGSLDEQYGVEFIFPPFTLNQITPDGAVGQWQSFLKNKATAWNAGKDYGMHISINAGAMKQLDCCKFCYFINSNPDFCMKISGRGDEWASYSNDPPDTYRRTTEKYRAAARRSHSRVEVRIFRASLNWERIRRNCEFVDAVAKYTRRTKVKNLSVDGFVKYLRGKSQYTNLRNFLNNVQIGVEV